MPRFPASSPTSDGLSDRVFGALAARARAQGGRLFALQVGDTWLEPPAVMRAEAQHTAAHPHLHAYAPVQGEPALLTAVVAQLEARGGAPVDVEHVQITCGGTAGLSCVVQALLDPGDEVLLPSPFWPLARGIVASRGAIPVQIPLFTRLDAPGFDVEDALERAVTLRTAAIYLNSPNNPTGRVLRPDALAAVARVAARHDLWVFCDEAYEELWLGDAPFAPAWARADLRGRSVAVHTLSKGYAFAGARVGFVHGPAEAMRAVRAVQTFHSYCAPRPMQLGAARGMREAGGWLAHARRVYREAGAKAADALGAPRPEGGTFLFVDVSHTLRDDAPDCTPFLERALDAGVWLTPGTACGRDFARHVRLCFTAVPPDALDEALAALAPLLRPR
jgi:N-succinyldiaminopimelate aminotransferase